MPLGRAMDSKREAGGVVDSISAEDIGKFPDTNLAESLQRITGVSIDRFPVAKVSSSQCGVLARNLILCWSMAGKWGVGKPKPRL